MDEAWLHGSCDFNHGPFEDTQFAFASASTEIKGPPSCVEPPSRFGLIFFLKSLFALSSILFSSVRTPRPSGKGKE